MLTEEQVTSLNEILDQSFKEIKSLDDREICLEILNNLYERKKIRNPYDQNASVKQLTGFLGDAIAETAKKWLAWEDLDTAQVQQIKDHVKTRIGLEIQEIQPEVDRESAKEDEATKLAQLKTDLDKLSVTDLRLRSPHDFDYFSKIALLGDTGVGKSCLLLRYVDDTYTDSGISTLGTDFKVKTLQIGDKIVKTQIWDNPELKRFRSAHAKYFQGIVIAFDTTDPVSFKNVERWIQESKSKPFSSENANIILVGTKADLSEKRRIERDEAQHLADSKGIPYIETSSKTGTNVQEAFKSLTENILLRIDPKHKEALPSKLDHRDAEELNLLKARKMIEAIEKMNDAKTINGAFLLIQPLFKNSKDKGWLDIAEKARKIAYNCMVTQYESLPELKQPRRNFLMLAKTLSIFNQRTHFDGFGFFASSKTLPVKAIEATLKDLEKTKWPELEVGSPSGFKHTMSGEEELRKATHPTVMGSSKNRK